MQAVLNICRCFIQNAKCPIRVVFGAEGFSGAFLWLFADLERIFGKLVGVANMQYKRLFQNKHLLI